MRVSNAADLDDLLGKLFQSLQTRVNKPRGEISVSFQTRYDETLSWDEEDNVSPYLNLSDPEKSITGLRDPLEIVIRLPKIQIEFDYPLEKPVKFDYDADTTDGFTRKRVAECIVSGYRKIYEEENAWVATQEGPERDPEQHLPMLNRETTHGPYGIWGHYIDNLAVSELIQIDDNTFGLEVDS